MIIQNQNTNLWSVIGNVFFVYIGLYVLLCWSSIFTKILSTLVIMLATIMGYYQYTMGTILGKEAFDSIYVSNLSEVRTFLGSEIFYFCCLLFFIVLMMKKIRIRINYKHYFIITTIFAAIHLSNTSYVYIVRAQDEIIFRSAPFFFICHTFKEIKNHHKYARLELQQIEHLDRSQILVSQEKPVIIVLIIGESARGDRFFINGYHRKHNNSIIEGRNLVSFTNVSSCGNSTAYSIPCLLSPLEESEFRVPLQNESLIHLFNRLNFYTSFYGIQDIGRNKNIVRSIEVADVFKNNIGSMDIELLDALRSQINNKKTYNQFIILHQIGSHWWYKDRYDDKFEIFKPECNKRNARLCDKTELDNVYDNSIAYTEFVVSEVIRVLKDERAILFFVSDHGEALGENQKYGHGASYPNSYQKHIPFMIWMSDSYLKDFGMEERFNLIKKFKNEKLSHDHLFYTILGSINVTSNYDRYKKLNLFSLK